MYDAWSQKMIHNNISTSGWWRDGEIPWNELDVCPMSFNESLHALDCFNNPGCTCKSIEPGDLRCSECGSIPSEIGYCTCWSSRISPYHVFTRMSTLSFTSLIYITRKNHSNTYLNILEYQHSNTTLEHRYKTQNLHAR